MAIKSFFKEQFQSRKFLLQDDVVSNFYLSSIQRNRSAVLLLFIRTVIFVGCLSIIVASMVLTSKTIPFGFWPIYMTHWGLVFNTIAAGLSVVVSLVAFIKGSLDTKTELPWYVQAYWAMFNIATPIAFFITVFYWVLLTGLDQDFAINPVLDVFIHAVNSVMMLALLLSARHPVYFFHFYFSIGMGIIYLIFSFVYFICGGKDPLGNHTIYPMMDWAKPGQTVGIAAASAVGIAMFHAVAVLLAACRDALTRCCWKDTMARNYNLT